MNYTDAEVFAATAAMDKYRAGEGGEASAALVLVLRGLRRKFGSATT